jgi:hypothetical protein
MAHHEIWMKSVPYRGSNWGWDENRIGIGRAETEGKTLSGTREGT